MSLTVEVVAPDGKRSWVTHKVAKLLVARGYRSSAANMYGGDDPDKFAWLAKATVAQVLEWVGNLGARAELATEIEQKRTPPRTSLLAKLEKVRAASA